MGRKVQAELLFQEQSFKPRNIEKLACDQIKILKMQYTHFEGMTKTTANLVLYVSE